MTMFQVTTPGKLIISGEHAVVYNNPALAAAIDRYVHVDLTFLEEPVIQFTFPGFTKHLTSLTFSEFWQTVEQLKLRYQQYLQGKCTITEVTTQIYDLPVYALGLFALFANKRFTRGVHITISGDLPIGYGMGSSAAIVVSLLRIANKLFAYPCRINEIHALAMQVENLQHGHSSGLDPCICLQGGMVLYSLDTVITRSLKAWPAYLLNTGRPQSSTGECVAWVKNHSSIYSLLDQFKSVTLTCDDALQNHSSNKLQQAIRENHRLLCELNVVPTRVQSCVSKLEKNNYAAKICGAGSIVGENAGYLLALGNNGEILAEIAHEFGYIVEEVRLGVATTSEFSAKTDVSY